MESYMIHRIEIRSKPSFTDPHGESVSMQIRELGISSVDSLGFARLMFLIGDLSKDQAKTIAEELLVDPVIEDYRIADDNQEPPAGLAIIEVHLQPGVMDPVAASAEKAIADMGFDIETVRTGRRYELSGSAAAGDAKTIGKRLLANAVIEDTFFQSHTPEEFHTSSYELKIIEVPIRDLDDDALVAMSEDGDLFLNLTEMKAIQDYYIKAEREPRDVELE
ncbi:MAG TPA: hypothetical protein ENL03_02955, partial [Phycisphaerae bacterium]|nr:hypothetical protein [Phycisphaerae bacterium]